MLLFICVRSFKCHAFLRLMLFWQVNGTMLDPILAEDSTITKVVPSLERIVKDLKDDSTHHDYLVALLIVFLAESGFYVPSTDNCSSEWYSTKFFYFLRVWFSWHKLFYIMKYLPQCKTQLHSYTRTLEITEHAGLRYHVSISSLSRCRMQVDRNSFRRYIDS